MKRIANGLLILISLALVLAVPVFATEYLVPGGQLIGLELQGNTVTVSAFDQTLTAGREAGLQIGDELRTIDGHPISGSADIRYALNRSDGDVDVVVTRDGREVNVRVAPDVTADGPKLGVYLRQGVTGIGTVTFYDPATWVFGTLGHGVSNSGGGLMTMTNGNAYPAGVQSIDRGRAGAPGQIRGILRDDALAGTLSKNTPQGVFGTLHESPVEETIPVAAPGEISTGPATIRSTLDEQGPREYSVEIVKIYPESRADGRNLLLKVTDPALLQTTGGIIQGMSGSPIIQDGKLVGAVTHVLVNDPTRGYGIFIENMLEAAG